MTTQDLILNLEAAGLDAPQIEQYLAYGQAENTARQLQLLSRHRAALLDRVHQIENVRAWPMQNSDLRGQ